MTNKDRLNKIILILNKFEMLRNAYTFIFNGKDLNLSRSFHCKDGVIDEFNRIKLIKTLITLLNSIDVSDITKVILQLPYSKITKIIVGNGGNNISFNQSTGPDYSNMSKIMNSIQFIPPPPNGILVSPNGSNFSSLSEFEDNNNIENKLSTEQREILDTFIDKFFEYNRNPMVQNNSNTELIATLIGEFIENLSMNDIPKDIADMYLRRHGIIIGFRPIM